MKRFLIALACALSITAVQADTLLVDRSKRAETAALPRRGSLMITVEAQYGAPNEKRDAVGDPPISRWIYPAFTVYFEHDHVVHAVLNKSTPNEQGPKPVQ
ncbi:MAG: hypothetical protein IPF83_10805 [Rhodanobacteraceae bacterium]|nr:hypothetical protein [Rhodanobacteraceae bacterium]MBK7042325.1 hypothetical protein [Rhodanobacteraceae bacterium]MBP9154795.1 hypothetical protein [Xanthomonadales bacterium]HQW80814.1 hypothetical protein [Pseudomonadota bacterium]